MTRKILVCLILLLPITVFAQGVRIGDSLPIWRATAGTNAVIAQSGAAIHVCSSPANAVPCTNYATTYTTSALSSSCGSSTQVVLAGTSTCTASADNYGNWGAWVAPGTYDVTWTIGGISYGPITITANLPPVSNATVTLNGLVTFNYVGGAVFNSIIVLGNGTTADWSLFDSVGQSFTISDQNTGKTRVSLITGADTFINSASAGAVNFNATANSGTGGVGFYNGTGATPTKVAAIDSNGRFTTYNKVATVGLGVASEVAAVDLTAQTAAVSTTTIYAVPSTGAGQYRLSWDAKVTTAAGTSSTLGALTITYTDPDGVAVTITAAGIKPDGTAATTNAGNTTGSALYGQSLLLNCKASTNIQYAFAYASNAANAMQYNLHIKLEAL